MPKCPNCGKNILVLNVEEEKEITYTIEISKSNHFSVFDTQVTLSSYEAKCPKCSSVISYGEEDAKAFLEGAFDPIGECAICGEELIQGEPLTEIRGGIPIKEGETYVLPSPNLISSICRSCYLTKLKPLMEAKNATKQRS